MSERVRQQIATSSSVKQGIVASQSFIDKLAEVAWIRTLAFRRGNRVNIMVEHIICGLVESAIFGRSKL